MFYEKIDFIKTEKNNNSSAYENTMDCQKIEFYNVTLNVWSLNESAMKFYEACGLVPQKIGMEHIL